MKKVIICLLLSTIIFCSCESDFAVEDRERRKLFETSETVNGYHVAIIEIDSCQYLISGVGYSQMMTHKGNCKFCEERKK
jgi:hypothetical protein